MQMPPADEGGDNILSQRTDATAGHRLTVFPAPRERMEGLFDDIVELSRTISVGIDAILVDLELSFARWQVLKWIPAGDDRTVAAIAEQLQLSKQAVQRVANELRGLGLIHIVPGIRRTAPPELTATRKGLEAYYEADARILAWCEHLQSTFSDVEFDRGREYVVRLRDAAKPLDDDLIAECRRNAIAIRAETGT